MLKKASSSGYDEVADIILIIKAPFSYHKQL